MDEKAQSSFGCYTSKSGEDQAKEKQLTQGDLLFCLRNIQNVASGDYSRLFNWQQLEKEQEKSAEALTKFLMEEVINRDNLNQAYRKVKANRGCAGVDGMTVNELSTQPT